jgi:signal peptidase I
MLKKTFTLAQLLGGLYFITDNIVQVRLAAGPSMLPTIDSQNNVIVIDMISPRFFQQGFKAGDLVMSKSVVEPDWFVCKRITALVRKMQPSIFLLSLAMYLFY